MIKTYKFGDRIQLGPHFHSNEFRCKCGKEHEYKVDENLITKLEALYSELGCSSIVITSGYRCPNHSVAVGGSSTDGHTCGIAADVNCYVDGVLANPYDVAAAAERVGFTGIGLMASNCHVDVRTKSNYKNDHWFGNEVTHDDNITTFQTVGSTGGSADESVKKGIDVSAYQGNINFSAVKQNIDFAIIRAGYGREITQVDKKFQDNYNGFKSVGVPVGAYWYSYAVTPEDMKKEAQAFIHTLKGKQFEYPVFLDLEEQSQFNTGKQNVSNMITTFCSEMEKAGYFVGLYSSTAALSSYVTDEVKSRYALWVADWRGYCGYSGNKVMWQIGTRTVPGITTGPVDYDYCYASFDVIKDKGFNGYTAKTETQQPVEPEVSTPENKIPEITKPVADTKTETQEDVLRQILEQVKQINDKL